VTFNKVATYVLILIHYVKSTNYFTALPDFTPFLYPQSDLLASVILYSILPPIDLFIHASMAKVIYKYNIVVQQLTITSRPLIFWDWIHVGLIQK